VLNTYLLLDLSVVLKDLVVDGWILLKLIFKKGDEEVWIGIDLA
jgi:hypothetical protein